jgi:surface polysaccharide O-acyltransferase-like enzyme
MVPVWRRYYFFPKINLLKTIQNKERIDFYDFLKGIAIIAVIIIHAGYFYSASDLDKHNLFFSLSNALSRFCIPIFFISSGILLRPWREIENKNKYYQKKFLRIFLPYIILVTLMAIYFKAPTSKYLYLLISGQALVPFYFVIVLLQLYLIYPILNRYRREKYFLLVTFLISFSVTLPFDPVVFFGIPVFIKFLFFFSYGMYMRDYFLSESRLKKIELTLWLTIVSTYIIILLIYPAMYFNFRLFFGLAIFNLLYYYRETLGRRTYLYKTLVNIGTYSLWIFLFHFLMEAQIYKLIINLPLNFYFIFILIILFTLSLSYFLARLVAPAYLKMLKMFDL